MQKPIKELLEFSILNIDKPSGPTSFDISDFVRAKMKELGVRKTSHFGTLDPKVTGVLPIALNRACKLTGFFLGENKEYIGVMRAHKEISIEDLQDIINKKFLGKIKQTPPKKSNVKREEREREIMEFKILEMDEENKKDFLFRAKVQGGTYIRKLIDDLGNEIGGAHMIELRRISAGIFSENENLVNLYDLENSIKIFQSTKSNSVSTHSNQQDFVGLEKAEEQLRKIFIPAEEAIKKIFPAVQAKKESVKKLLTGKPIMKGDIIGKIEKEKFALFYGDKFIGIYNKVNQGDIIARPEFVLQEMR